MNNETEMLILSTLQEIKQSVDTLKQNVDTLKQDVNTLKTDVNTLKTDVSTLKTDVVKLKQFTVEATERMDRMEKNLNILQSELIRNSEQHVEMTLELKDIKNTVNDAIKDSKSRDEKLDNKIDARNDLIMQSLENNKSNAKRINKIETLLKCSNV